jgi:orotate phosphoribosyltransferase
MLPSAEQARNELYDLLKRQSVFHGDFTLASGARSAYYFDCRLTTMDPKGAWLVGQTMHTLLRREQAARKKPIDAVGGLTMGADPIALAVGMHSYWAGDAVPLRVFSVRKTAKAHGQTRLIEGNFRSGDTVVVLEDVVTRGESTIAAINAVANEGGAVAFVAVLVDRQEGGRERIESLGYPVISLFKRDELLGLPTPQPTGCTDGWSGAS